MNHPSLKICVGYHKPSFLLQGECFVPVWGGKLAAHEPSKDGAGISQEENQWMEKYCIGDDTGDNISAQNRHYCEASILYWMWKNYDKLGNPDWIGFLQYRRHWRLNPQFQTDREPNRHNLLFKKYFSPQHQTEIGLTQEKLLEELSSCDGIFCSNDTHETVRHYKENHHSQDIKYWNKALEIIRKDWPQYARAAEEYDASTWHAWSNCFIMRREDFLEYAPFLFDVLKKIDQFAAPDYPNMTPEKMRVPAYVSETMLGIFWMYLLDKGKKIKHFPLVYVRQPFLPQEILPTHPQAIPVVFIADRAYLPYTAVAIESIIAHASPKRYYDIIILHNGQINSQDIERLQQIQSEHISVRFFDATYYMEGYQFSQFWHTRLNLMPYLKGFIPYILSTYDKAIFLDGDLIVQQDIAQLYDMNLEGNLAAAVPDWIVGYTQVLHWENKRKYCAEQGHMQDVHHYFNSGVLLMDLAATRKEDTFLPRFIEQSRFSHPGRNNHDQDSLNFILEGKTKLLPTTYNFQTALILPKNYDFLPKEIQAQLPAIKRGAFIIHFDGDLSKPWKSYPTGALSQAWWNYARNAPFYEELLHHMISSRYTHESALLRSRYKTLFQYYRIKFMSKITIGKRRKHYEEKLSSLKQRLEKIRQVRTRHPRI